MKRGEGVVKEVRGGTERGVKGSERYRDMNEEIKENKY